MDALLVDLRVYSLVFRDSLITFATGNHRTAIQYVQLLKIYLQEAEMTIRKISDRIKNEERKNRELAEVDDECR